MNWNEMKRLAISKGYEFVRHGSRHDIYRHPVKKDILQIERHWYVLILILLEDTL